ncbi:hypothetical protein SPHINGOAX6_60034 [Sphingomonas sp. AX6]|nr:hypothetical protein SPHINGOAX6_60034 [Sphingomonas sp. AX6]
MSFVWNEYGCPLPAMHRNGKSFAP